MVSAIAVWSSILAGNDLLSRGAVFCAADDCGGIHRYTIGKSVAPEQLTVTISLNASELERDLERIEDGELSLPTVSAVKISINGVFEESFPICLPEA